MVTAEQVKDIITRTAALGRYLDIDKKLARIEADEEKTQDPAFWNDAKEAERLMKHLRSEKRWVDDFHEVKTAADDLEVITIFTNRKAPPKRKWRSTTPPRGKNWKTSNFATCSPAKRMP